MNPEYRTQIENAWAVDNIKNQNKPASMRNSEFWDLFIDPLIQNLPDERKRTYESTLKRHAYLSSYGRFSNADVEIYDKGIYIKAEGLHSSYNLWVNNNGTYQRKPRNVKFKSTIDLINI